MGGSGTTYFQKKFEVIAIITSKKDEVGKISEKILSNPTTANEKVMNFIKNNTIVPKLVYDEKIKCTYFTSFDLNKKGEMSSTDVHAVFFYDKNGFVKSKSECPDCKDEFLRILKIIPKDLLLELKAEQKNSDTKGKGKLVIMANFPT
jgi:hypothetical protein